MTLIEGVLSSRNPPPEGWIREFAFESGNREFRTPGIEGPLRKSLVPLEIGRKRECVS